jgi:hypothetical protein
MQSSPLIRTIFDLNQSFMNTQNDGKVSWNRSKKKTMEVFTTKAEYITTLEVAMEGVWIKKFITKLGMVSSALEPMDHY